MITSKKDRMFPFLKRQGRHTDTIFFKEKLTTFFQLYGISEKVSFQLYGIMHSLLSRVVWNIDDGLSIFL